MILMLLAAVGNVGVTVSTHLIVGKVKVQPPVASWTTSKNKWDGLAGAVNVSVVLADRVILAFTDTFQSIFVPVIVCMSCQQW